jgi:capsular exopolysaccharide synthesis family protein
MQTRLDQEIQNAVDAVKSDYRAAMETENQLGKALEAQKTETLGLSRKGIEYANLLHDSQSNHQLYDNLLARAKETGVTGDYKGSNIQIVDKAEIPRSPILPRTSHDLMIAFIEGCLLAFGLAFGLEYVDSRIRTPDEIKEHLGLPFLGIVPAVGEIKPEEEQVLLVNARVPPGFGEAIRAIRTAVIFSSPDEGARSVVITSTAPSEGKTVVSTNLAASLAQADQRTLLIDGDMRRPRVHEVFAREQEPGLSNVLVGTTEAHEAVRPTSVPNLFVLAAGHLPPNPVELLASNKYREFLHELRHQFDWIIIDAPPVMAVTDAAVLSHGATGVVFVVGAEMTARRNAIAAVEQLTSAKAHFIGAVLNKVDLVGHAYYYSPYYRKDYTRAYERTN